MGFQSFPKLASVWMLALVSPCLRATEIRGCVTRAGTPERFFVNEREVRCVPGKTKVRQLRSDGFDPEQRVACPQWVLGDSLTVRGREDKPADAVVANVLELDPPQGVLKVEGFGLVDRILSPVPPDTGLVRADGYLLAIMPATKLSFASGMSRQPAPNQWVHYAGALRADGTVTAHSLAFTPNTVSHLEDKLRTKTEFDAAAVKEADRQNGFNKYFLGLNAKKIPAWDDPEMQARIDRVGTKLVPKFQRDLPEDNSTKIHFRFQLVDEKAIPDGITLPSGIILVPYQVLVALPNDNELAAVLASDIAEILEEQTVRSVPGNTALTGTNLASEAALFLVPIAGIGGMIGTGTVAHLREVHLMQQSTRNALVLMHDANFDIREAPLAWWRLADWREIPLWKVNMPDRTRYAYFVLNTAWRGTLPSANP